MWVPTESLAQDQLKKSSDCFYYGLAAALRPSEGPRGRFALLSFRPQQYECLRTLHDLTRPNTGTGTSVF